MFYGRIIAHNRKKLLIFFIINFVCISLVFPTQPLSRIQHILSTFEGEKIFFQNGQQNISSCDAAESFWQARERLRRALQMIYILYASCV